MEKHSGENEMEITAKEEGPYTIITIKTMRSPMNKYIVTDNAIVLNQDTPGDWVSARKHQDALDQLEDLKDIVEKALGLKIFHHNSEPIRGWAAQWPRPIESGIRSSEHMIESYLVKGMKSIREELKENEMGWELKSLSDHDLGEKITELEHYIENPFVAQKDRKEAEMKLNKYSCEYHSRGRFID
jgi:hypothetical protein